MTWQDTATTLVQAYLNGVATDITQYVLTPSQSITASSGRQNELSQMEPSRLSLVLNNIDGRFTPGNTASPYYPYWRQAIRIVWTETVGARSFVLFDGYLEIPEMRLDYQLADPTVNNATLTVSASDILTRLGRTRPFISTLAEYIRWAGGSALRFYAPLSDGPVWADLVGGTRRNNNTTSGDAVGTLLTSGTNAIALADDLPSDAEFTAIDSPGAVEQLAYEPSGLTIGPGEALTAMAWIRPTAHRTDRPIPLFLFITETGPSALGAINLQPLSPSAPWSVDVGGTGAMSGTLTSTRALVYDEPLLIGVRFAYSPATLELWINGEQFVGSLSGSPPSTATVSTFYAPFATYQGTIAHSQIYIGDPDEYTFESFRAQYEMGLHGLDRQKTGERIRTVLGYAGVSESAMDRIDPGTSFMSAASLAGQTPLAGIQTAADTERGRLFSARGEVVFHDRHRIYDT